MEVNVWGYVALVVGSAGASFVEAAAFHRAVMSMMSYAVTPPTFPFVVGYLSVSTVMDTQQDMTI